MRQCYITGKHVYFANRSQIKEASPATRDFAKKIIETNECRNSTDNNCHSNANCINTFGGFDCECKTGFSGSGVDCLETRNL